MRLKSTSALQYLAQVGNDILAFPCTNALGLDDIVLFKLGKIKVRMSGVT